MIVTFTDFGVAGPYLGQLHAALLRDSPGSRVVDLMTGAPIENPRAAAYLLAAFAKDFPAETVFLCVVDPGVGTDQRLPVVLRAGDRWYVGPDNGLLDIVARRYPPAACWEIIWQPKYLSASFHGRDLFAPIAAWIDSGVDISDRLCALPGGCARGWSDDLFEVIYIDHFGNAMTGIRSASVAMNSVLVIGKQRLHQARTFGDATGSDGFWYENSSGLIEIAVNRGRAADQLGLCIGELVEVEGF